MKNWQRIHDEWEQAAAELVERTADYVSALQDSEEVPDRLKRVATQAANQELQMMTILSTILHAPEVMPEDGMEEDDEVVSDTLPEHPEAPRSEASLELTHQDLTDLDRLYNATPDGVDPFSTEPGYVGRRRA